MKHCVVAAALFCASVAQAADVTDPATLDNLMGAVQSAGKSCTRVVTAQRLEGSPEFIVVCASGASDFYRVKIPPSGGAIVTAESWRR